MIYIQRCLCVKFYDSTLVGCWSSLSIRRIIYKFLNVCPFGLYSFCGKWEGWYPVNQFNLTSWMAEVTPTDSHKAVRNRCVIEILVASMCCLLTFVEFSKGVF